MRRTVLAVLGLVAALPAGCMATRRAEYSRETRYGACADGTPGCSDQAYYKERRWFGPWPFMPDRVRE